MRTDPAGIPDELKTVRQWVSWQLVQKPGKPKPDKVPFSPVTGKGADAGNPATWTDFATALDFAGRRGHDGIGFEFAPPYVGIDFDHCIDPATGAIDPKVLRWVRLLDSYTEKSQSRLGLHTVVKAQKPGDRCKRGDFEIYERGRYFAMTGDHLEGTPATVEPRQAQLEQVYREIFGAPAQAAKPSPKAAPQEDDADLIERARAAKGGAKFDRLWSGDVTGYLSHSEADAALCAILAFWTGRDAARMDRLFRMSGLMRDKWDERHGAQTYGAKTISGAIGLSTAGYGRGVLKKQQWRIGHAAEGKERDALRKAAIEVGQFIAGGAIERAEAEAHLLASASAAGIASEVAENIVQTGLDAGMADPKTPPTGESPGKRRLDPPPKDAATLAHFSGWVRDALATGGNRETKQSIADALGDWLLSKGALVVDDAQDDQAGGRPYVADGGALWPLEADVAPVRLMLHRAGLNGSEGVFAFVMEHLRMAALDKGRHTQLLRWQGERGGVLHVTCGARHLVRVIGERLEKIVNGSNDVWAAGDAAYPEWTPAGPSLPWELSAFQPAYETPPEAPAYTPEVQVRLLSAWIGALLAGVRPLPLLLCLGQRGGGKSTLARAIVKVFNGETADLTTLGSDQRDFEALLPAGVVGLDQLDAVNAKDGQARNAAPWLPDALANATTGGVIRRRRLYSDGAETVRPITSAIILTTRSAEFVRADVAERVLPILTGGFEDGARRADSELIGAVLSHRDGILSWAALTAGKMLDGRRDAPRGLPLRFQDFAACLWAALRSWGEEESAGDVCRALRAAQALAVQESDPLAEALNLHVDDLMGWYAPIALLQRLREAGADVPFLQNGKAVSRRLRELRPTLALCGVVLTERKNGHGAEWRADRS